MWAYDKSFTDQDCQYWLDWNMNSYRSDGFGLWKIIHKETSE
ncbi:N-acetyltransferase, partial [Streptococcus agalactiae]